MGNAFNSNFISIAVKTKSNIKLQSITQTTYLIQTNTFFFTSTDKNEISFIISSIDLHKSSDPNSISVKILKLLKNDISQQLYTFNMYFLIGQFPSVLKIAKAESMHKKNLKLIIQIIDKYPS